MSSTMTRNKHERGCVLRFVRNYVILSDFMHTDRAWSCHRPSGPLSPGRNGCPGARTWVSWLPGFLSHLQGWACGIPFSKVIGASQAGLQALTCHRVAGVPLLKGMWWACQSTFWNTQILPHAISTQLEPLSLFFFKRFECKMKSQSSGYGSLTFECCISIFLLDIAWRRDAAETRSAKANEGIQCAHCRDASLWWFLNIDFNTIGLSNILYDLSLQMRAIKAK